MICMYDLWLSQSEYAADPDKRIWYMTGFNGTGGMSALND